MRKFLSTMFVIGAIFILEYEGYYWSPCDGNGNCLAIQGHDVTPETVVCKSVKEVEGHLNKNGTEHLTGVYEVWVDTRLKTATVKEMEIIKKISIKE